MADYITDLTRFLNGEVGAAYVWSGDGEIIRGKAVYRDQRLVNASYADWVRKRETSEANAARALAFIEGKLAEGVSEVACYDCSGLIVRYLRDIARLIESDVSSRGLFRMCDEIERTKLREGDLVFRHDGKKIHHVGVYIGRGTAIEAKGRDAGVVKRGLDAAGVNYWNRFGRLALLTQEAKADASGADAPGADAHARYASCTGEGVNLRAGAGTRNASLALVKKGTPLLAMSAEKGWANVACEADGRITAGYMSADYIQYK